jgi:hypothetical protein
MHILHTPISNVLETPTLIMSVQLYAPLLDRIRREYHSFPTIILHYDPEIRDLTVWFWWVPTCVTLLACTYLSAKACYPRRGAYYSL